MTAIKLIAFAGELPRMAPRLLPETAAQSAINTRLDDGSLTPIRAAIRHATLDTSEPKTIFRHNGEWLSWETLVHAAPGPVDDSRLYFTGDGVPKLLANGQEYGLAVPRPTVALTATLAGTGDGDTVARIYVYTWVTEFGEESEPSPPSTPLNWKPGNSVDLTGFADAPPGRAIASQRIYRTQTGTSGTFLYFIAERAVSDDDFADTVPVDGFVEPLPSADWNAPPDDLAGLVSLPNGIMAGFSGREICFSEPFRPHAWPEKYRQTVDSDIVGLAAIGSALIVLTVTNPSIGSGSTPESFQFTKIENNWPCTNANGIVDLGFAVCYPTHEGLVAIDAGGGSRLVTEQLLSRQQWKQLVPHKMVAGQLSGRYIAFYEASSPDGPQGRSVSFAVGSNPFLTRTDLRARAAYYDVAEAALYFVPLGTNEVWRYDAPGEARETQYWRSKKFVLNAEHNFGALLVDAKVDISPEDQDAAFRRRQEVIDANQALLSAPLRGELGGAAINCFGINGDRLAPLPPLAGHVVVGVLADGVRVADVRILNRATRLPAGFKARTWEIDVAGDVGVTSIILGSTMADIAATP